MPSTNPQVDKDTWRIPMETAPGSPSISRNRVTWSKLSSGSPIPIKTMDETRI